MAVSLVLACDQPLVIEALESLCRREADLQVVATSPSESATLTALAEHHPDVLVLDIEPPCSSCEAILGAIAAGGYKTRVVLLSAGIDDEDLLSAIRLGVSGVIPRDAARELYAECIRSVSRGDQWLDGRTVGRVVQKLLHREAGFREIASVLTAREIEIFRLAAAGQSNKVIAATLFVSIGTVKTHLHHIFRKLKRDTRASLAEFAKAKGLLPPSGGTPKRQNTL